jgi:hypothetical protein
LRQLQGMDSSFVALESPNSPMHIGNLLIYNPETAPGGFVRFKDILQFFESRMQLSKTMRQRLVRVPFDLDYPYWIETPISISNTMSAMSPCPSRATGANCASRPRAFMPGRWT